MGFKSWLSKKKKEYQVNSARKRAANKIIKEKATSAYYREKEKAAVKAAGRRAREEYKPKPKGSGGDPFALFNSLAGSGSGSSKKKRRKEPDFMSDGFF